MSLKVGESGANKIFRVAAGFNMASFTELTITFYKPTGAIVSKTTADGVVLGAGVTDPDLGVLTANEYVDYPIEPLLLTESGTVAGGDPWKAILTYTNTVSTPDDIFIGDCAVFDVDPADCSG